MSALSRGVFDDVIQHLPYCSATFVITNCTCFVILAESVNALNCTCEVCGRFPVIGGSSKCKLICVGL